MIACDVLLPNITASRSVTIAGVALAGCSVIGGLLPDVDHPTSTISKKGKILFLPYRLLNKLFCLLNIKSLEHRGIMHTFIIPAVISLVAALSGATVLRYALFGILLGYLSHLFCDALNPMGVPLFWPLYKGKIRFIPKAVCIRTGSTAETVFRVLLRVGVIASFIPVVLSIWHAVIK